jgi:hypothetical protein
MAREDCVRRRVDAIAGIVLAIGLAVVVAACAKFSHSTAKGFAEDAGPASNALLGYPDPAKEGDGNGK